MLYCTLLFIHSTVLYSTVSSQYYNVLFVFFIGLYCTLLFIHSTVLYSTVYSHYCTVVYSTVYSHYCTVVYSTVLPSQVRGQWCGTAGRPRGGGFRVWQVPLTLQYSTVMSAIKAYNGYHPCHSTLDKSSCHYNLFGYHTWNCQPRCWEATVQYISARCSTIWPWKVKALYGAGICTHWYLERFSW